MAIPPLIFRNLIYPAGVDHSNYRGGVEAGSDAQAYPIPRNRLSMAAKGAKNTSWRDARASPEINPDQSGRIVT
jgi:hypothetical protein